MSVIHNIADGKILVELPVMIGDSVYVVSGQKRRVYTNRVAEYAIRGNSGSKNSVKLISTDKNGMVKEAWWGLNAFGKTLFTDRDDAIRRMEELWDDVV